MLNWVLYIGITIVAYVGITLFGRITTGMSETVWGTVKALFTPLPLLLLVTANALFVAGLHYGFLVTQNPIVIAIALGVLTSFTYAVVLAGVPITFSKVAGLVCILIGIYLLR